jgi:Domain of unknown function (DUF4278)
MKLTYRGQSYSISAPVQINPASTDPFKTRLIYRGHAYNATPCPAVDSATSTAGSMVTLTYRGIPYQRVLKNQKSDHPGRAIDWRYEPFSE